MEGQLTEAEKARRSGVLLDIEKEMSHAYRAGFAGREVEVLFEEKKEKNGRDYWIGHTPQYVKAAKAVESEAENLENKIVKVRPSGFLEEDVLV